MQPKIEVKNKGVFVENKGMVMNVALGDISIQEPEKAQQTMNSNEMGNVSLGKVGADVGSSISNKVDEGNVTTSVDESKVSATLNYTEQLNQIINNTAVNFRDNINVIASAVGISATILGGIYKKMTDKKGSAMATKAKGVAPKGGIMSKLSKAGKFVTSVASANPTLVAVLAIGAAITAAIVAYKAYKKHQKGKAEKEKNATQTANEMYKSLTVTSEKVSISAKQLTVNMGETPSTPMPISSTSNATAYTAYTGLVGAKSAISTNNTNAYNNHTISDNNDIRNTYSIVSSDTKGNDVYNYNITNNNKFDTHITKDVDYDYIEQRMIDLLTNGLLKEGSNTGTIQLGQPL